MVEGEEAGEDFLVGEVRGPAVGGEDGFVEGAVGVREPLGTSVVKLGEGAGLEVVLGGAGRVEPSVEFFCDINYDAFKFMADNGKKYSFVISLYEYVETIPTLWDSVKKFMKKYPEHIVEGNSMSFLSDDGGDTYNHCHMVSQTVPWVTMQANKPKVVEL